MRSLRRALAFFSSPGTAAIAMVAAGSLVWAGMNTGPAEGDLAAVQQNGCSVTTGNGRVNDKPSANCPVDIKLSGPLSVSSSAAATNMAPGDVVHRRLDVTNVGNNTLDSIVVKAQPAASAINGSLRLTVRRCSVAWTGIDTCSGTTTTVLNAGTLPQTGINLGNSPAKVKKGVDRLLVSVQFLGSAGNTLQGSSTTMTYTFTATKN